MLPGLGPVQVYVKLAPELEAVASIVIVCTAQVRVAAGSAEVIGMFTSAVTVTEDVAVQPFVVFVTSKV
jgi:folate-dependent tRNA-U54 methylase TrmFO/GidA